MPRYPLASILLHWTMAVAIGAAWAIGSLIEAFPRAERAGPLGVHALIGLAGAALLLPRLLARLAAGAPAPEGAAWERRLAAAVHLLLYALMLAVPLSGLAMAMSARQPLALPWLGELPTLLRPLGLRGLFGEAHELLANLLVGAVALHVAAALWHALVRRDGAMRRMLPLGRRQPAR